MAILEPTRAEWLAERRTGIGGSDSAAAAGLSKWKTKLALYAEKIGEFTVDETWDMYRGTVLEPAVRQMYCDRTGFTVEKPVCTIRHPKLRWMLASLDGVAPCVGRVVDCKTARSRDGWGDPGSADVPIDYLCQVTHYMTVTGLEVADLAVLFGNFEFDIYTVPFDAEFAEMLIDAESAFWQAVESREPPEPATIDDIKLRWPRSFAKQIEAPHNVADALRMLSEAKSTGKKIEHDIELLESQIKTFMGDHDTLTIDGKPAATWKSTATSTRFDAKGFQAAQPETYEQYLIPANPQRRFLLKK